VNPCCRTRAVVLALLLSVTTWAVAAPVNDGLAQLWHARHCTTAGHLHDAASATAHKDHIAHGSQPAAVNGSPHHGHHQAGGARAAAVVNDSGQGNDANANCCPPVGLLHISQEAPQPLLTICASLAGCCTVQQDRSTPARCVQAIVDNAPEAHQVTVVAVEAACIAGNMRPVSAAPYAKTIFDLKSDLRI
jgi:hypothetical protein